MLRELHISNLAVIADVRIELAAGLNCFTGATGAGKSLVIGAIEVLLGMRSPAEMLRSGAVEGRVSGVFDIRDADLLKQIDALTDSPISADGGEVLITRKLYSSGRSSISLNGNPITLAMLKNVAEYLVDVHGQHDHQFLLRPANQLDVIDQFGELRSLRQQYHVVFARLSEAKRRLESLSTGRSLRDQRLELCRFQADEIDAAELDVAEFAELEARASVLENLEKLKKDATGAHAALYEADGSVLERLRGICAVITELSHLDGDLKPVAGAMRDAAIGLEEAALDLSRYLGRLDLDPGELAEVTDRLNIINRVLSKYGNSVEAALEHRAGLARQIAELEHDTQDLSSLNGEIEKTRKEIKQLGQDLSAKRQAVARRLAPRIEAALADLGMEKAKFSISFAPAPSALAGETLPISPSGFDAVEFIAQTNPGQQPQPLRKIASGGELSRIMLALKGILASGDRISVLVFDEIDANVGGRLGSIIGSKLRALANHHQVLCITHLPQIASYADRHLTVRKEVKGETTQTQVRIMDGEERVTELAEMIGGQHITPITRAQAAELLEAARQEEHGRPGAEPAVKTRKPMKVKAKS